MTPLIEILRSEIAAHGPLAFAQFMETALYHPEHGYYRRARDPFGREGDFYTAEQVQPAFGLLIAASVEALWRDMGSPPDFTVVEMGAGREEMAEHFARWQYVPVDAGRGALPERVRGVIFSNEFFDALPVDAVRMTPEGPRMLRVGWDGARFVWTEGEPAHEEYVHRYFPEARPGDLMEVGVEACRWMERLAAVLERGYVFTIDYGYTTRESVRFPRGTLMSYRRHTALEDVLSEPGARDLTAHVHFTALEDAARGLERVRYESLARTLLRVDEPTAAAVARAHPLAFKTLVFGMGETFRTLLLRKAG